MNHQPVSMIICCSMKALYHRLQFSFCFHLLLLCLWTPYKLLQISQSVKFQFPWLKNDQFRDSKLSGWRADVIMENSAFKNKFKTFLQKTPKINFDFNRQDGLASPGADGSRIPEEWAGLVGVGSPGRRVEGVFVADNDNEMSKTDDEVLSGLV